MKPIQYLLCFISCSLLTPASADMDGNFPGRGDRNAWKHAATIVNAGIAARENGDNQKAVSLYKQAIAEYPYDSAFYYQLGKTYVSMKAPEAGLSMLQRSAALQRTSDTFAEMAVADAVLKRWKDADTALSTARSLARSNDDAAAVERIKMFVKQQREAHHQ